MAKKKTALERVRSNPRNTTAKELMKVLEEHGFRLRKVTGDHHIYKKDGFRPIPIPSRQNPIAMKIVKEVLEVIDSLSE